MHDIWRFQHFLGVVDAGSFHGAARAMNISQPALTKSIRLLEEAFGTELFLRLPRGVRLTEAGEMMHIRAREVEAAWNAAIVEVGAQSKGLGGTMRIGGGPVYSSVHFPNMLADLRRRFPHLKVQVSTGVGSELLPMLKTGDIRVYAGGIPRTEGGTFNLGAEFKTIELYQQQNAIFASSQHPLFLKGRVEPADTLDYPWLCLFSGQQANIQIRNYFEARGLPEPRVALESHSLQIAFKMIAEHQFIGCMPVPLSATSEGRDLKEVALDGFRWSIPTGITFHRSFVDFAPITQMIRSLNAVTEPLREGEGSPASVARARP